jgi:tetratricopeptide (TPR) repeat protein
MHEAIQEIIAVENPLKPDEISKLARSALKFSDYFMTTPSKSIMFYKQGFEDAEKNHSEDEMIKFASKLGEAYTRTKDYPVGLVYLNKALESSRKRYGETSQETAEHYASMVSAYWMIEDFNEALKYNSKCLEIRTKILSNQPDTAATYHMTGSILGSLGRFEEALNNTQKAVDIFRTTLGEMHPTTAFSYNQIGQILSEMGHNEEALVFAQKALNIRRAILSEYHFDTGESYKTVGAILMRLEKSKPIYTKDTELAYYHIKKALDIQEKITGKIDPDLQNTYDYLKKAFEMHERFQGPSTPFGFHAI